jgi:2,3,4,5-tetrahydropyridine-2-carboxylate N-succinyltransferase
MTDQAEDRALVEAAFADRARLKDAAYSAAVERTIAKLDRGELRVASPPAERAEGERDDGEWTTHAWIKQAILLYFAVRGMETLSVGPFEFHDKIPLKKGLDRA